MIRSTSPASLANYTRMSEEPGVSSSEMRSTTSPLGGNSSGLFLSHFSSPAPLNGRRRLSI